MNLTDRGTDRGTDGGAYRRSPRAIWRASANLLVAAVPPAAPTRIVGSAAMVWNHLAAPVGIDELVAELAAVSGSSAAAIRADVESLLAALVPLGLVEVQA
ncbi:MAG: PqqD family protein [Actinomycetota bacterium]|nr:PqqD family protein [Actinomycetota bacterium]